MATVGQLTADKKALDPRTIVENEEAIDNITQAYVGLIIYNKENGKLYKVTEINSLSGKVVNSIVLPPSSIGAQPEINNNNKLSADNIVDGTTNKVVTQTDKTTWNGKQNALTTEQLSNITKGGTALQPSSTSGLLKNDGTIDTETQGKAANAIQMPSGASSDKVLGYENGAVAWITKPSNGQNGAQGPQGEAGHNPCLGRFTRTPSPMPTAQVGDYLYVDTTTTDPNTQEETTTTTVYHYGNNGWDIGTDIDAEHPTLASGQAVTSVHIKDLDGEDDPTAQGVLSASAGHHLNEQLNGAPTNIASNGYMDANGIMHAITLNTYETSVFIPVSLEVGDVLEFTEGETGNAQSRLCFFEYNTPTTSEPDNNKATAYKALIAAPRTITITANDSALLDSHYMKMCWEMVNRDNVYIKLNDEYIYRPTAGGEGEFVRKEEFTQELGGINQSIGTKSQDSDLDADDVWGAIEEVNQKTEDSSMGDEEVELQPIIVNNIAIGDQHSIVSNSNSTLKYVHLNAGDYIKVAIGNGLGRFRYGFTAQVPAVNVAVTDDGVESNPTNLTVIDTTVESECYVCVSASKRDIDYCTFISKRSIKDSIEIIEGDIASIKNDIPSIEQKFIQSKFANPSNSSKCLTLLHFSDIHGGADNLTRIVAFKQQWQSYIDDAICTGDIVNTDITSGSIFDQNNASYVNGSNSILLCTGNHDTKSPGTGIGYWYDKADTEDEYNLIMGNCTNWGDIVQPSGAGQNSYYPCYYYKDYTSAGVRLIVLDMMSLGKAVYDANDSTDNLGQNAQIVWLNDRLNDAKTNHLHVVIAQHFPFISKGVGSVTNNASAIEGDFSIPNGDYEYRSGRIDNQITTKALPYLSGLIEDFKDGGGNFVCWICGHTHWDLIEQVKDTDQKVIVISAAKYNASNQRTIRNTTDESMDLFNIFSVDTINRVVKIFRVGSHLTPALQKIDTMHFTY